MFIEERHEAILKMLQENGRISVGEIQAQFDVSVDSARRDLRLLEDRGLLKRTYGGAILLSQVGALPQRSQDTKKLEIYPNYAAIAKKGASFIKENDVVCLIGGVLGFAMLKYLPKDIPFTLVINSASLAEELQDWDNITVYLTGGKIRKHSTPIMVDSFATAFVQNMHFDLCLMTGAGYDAAFGFSNSTSEAAVFQRAVLGNARRKILMMPHNKIGFHAFIKVCDADRFDTLITDWDAVEDELNKLEDIGVKVFAVEKE